MTTYLTALDERIKVAAIGCYITSWGQILDGPGPQEAEQSLYRFLAEGLDMGDYLALIAPRPLLVFSTVNDFFPLEGARAVVEEGKRHYALLGRPAAQASAPLNVPGVRQGQPPPPPNASGGGEAQAPAPSTLRGEPDRLSWFVGPGGHGTPREAREALAAFFLRWFRNGEGDPRVEGDPHLDAEDLACTESGQVATSPALHARTVADLIATRAAEVRPLRKLATGSEVAAHRRSVMEAAARVPAITVRPGGAPPPVTVHRSIERTGEGAGKRVGYRLDVVSLAAAPGVTLWGLLAVPEAPGRKPAVLIADPRLRGPLADAGGELDQLARAGTLVLAIEPRGGEPEPDPPGRPSLLGSYAALERRAEVVGKTLVGMRAEDLIRAVDYLASRPDVDRGRIAAFAQGALGVPLLHAAVLDSRIGRVGVRETLLTYRSVLDRSIHRNLPEVAIPGVLRHYDLDDLLLALAPRPVTLIAPLDPVGQPLPTAEWERTLRPVLEADRRAGGGDRIRVVRRGGPELLVIRP